MIVLPPAPAAIATYKEAMPRAISEAHVQPEQTNPMKTLATSIATEFSEGGAAVAVQHSITVFNVGSNVRIYVGMETGNVAAHLFDLRAEAAEFLSMLYALCMDEKPREANALALDHFDEALNSGRFTECNYILSQMHPEQLAPSTIISVLTITYHAGRRLPAREAFYQAAFREVARREGKKYAKELLAQYR